MLLTEATSIPAVYLKFASTSRVVLLAGLLQNTHRIYRVARAVLVSMASMASMASRALLVSMGPRPLKPWLQLR